MMMKYFANAVKYSFNNLKYTILFALLPAVFVGYFVQPFCLSNFLGSYPNLVVEGYTSVFNAFFNFKWQNIILTTLALVVIVFIMTLLFGYVERHMRTGKFSIADTKQIFNSNILVVGLYSLLIIVLYMVFMIVLSLILFCVHLLMSGANCLPTTANIVITYLISIVFFLTFFRLLMQIYLSIPETLTTGYSLSSCMREVGDSLGKNTFKVYVAYALPLVVHFPVLALTFGHWTHIIVTFVLMMFYIIYYVSLTYVVYFDIYNLPRKDVDTLALLFRRK